MRNTLFDGGLNDGKTRSYIMLYQVVGHVCIQGFAWGTRGFDKVGVLVIGCWSKLPRGPARF